jgi:myosin heavy subunit
VRSNLEALQQECKRLLSDLELAGCRLSRQLDQKAIVEQNAQDLEKLKRTLKRLSADCRARFDVWGFSGGAGWEKQARWDALRPMDSLLQDVQVCVAKLREVFYSQRDVLESVGLNESPLIQYLADEALVEDRSWYEFLQQEAPYSDLLAIPRDQLSKKYQTELETANIDVQNLPKWEQQFMKEKDALQGLKEALRELHWLHEQLSRDAFEAEAAKMALSAKWKEIPKKQARCVELKDTAKDLQAESGQLFAALEQIKREKSMVERDAQLAVLIRKHGALKERLYKLSAEAMDREALVHELVRMRQRVDELETKLRVL